MPLRTIGMRTATVRYARRHKDEQAARRTKFIKGPVRIVLQNASPPPQPAPQPQRPGVSKCPASEGHRFQKCPHCGVLVIRMAKHLRKVHANRPMTKE
jgi:hypothetical protein